jgi:uncharacterized membrane protein YjjP (DUF1212 family)
MTTVELQRALDAIAARPRRYPELLRVLGAAFACAAFALLNNGGWQEFVAVALAAGAGQFVRMRLGRLRTNEFLVVFASATTSLLSTSASRRRSPRSGSPAASTTPP